MKKIALILMAILAAVTVTACFPSSLYDDVTSALSSQTEVSSAAENNDAEASTKEEASSEEEVSSEAEESEAATITKAEYDKIKNGMSYDDVVKIVGGEGESLSDSEIAGIKTAVYMWYGDDQISNANIMIQNGKVVSKAQFGL